MSSSSILILDNSISKFTTLLQDNNKQWRYYCLGKHRSIKFSLFTLANVTFLSLLVHFQTKHKEVVYIGALNKSSGWLTEKPTWGKEESPAQIINSTGLNASCCKLASYPGRQLISRSATNWGQAPFYTSAIPSTQKFQRCHDVIIAKRKIWLSQGHSSHHEVPKNFKRLPPSIKIYHETNKFQI